MIDSKTLSGTASAVGVAILLASCDSAPPVRATYADACMEGNEGKAFIVRGKFDATTIECEGFDCKVEFSDIAKSVPPAPLISINALIKEGKDAGEFSTVGGGGGFGYRGYQSEEVDEFLFHLADGGVAKINDVIDLTGTLKTFREAPDVTGLSKIARFCEMRVDQLAKPAAEAE